MFEFLEFADELFAKSQGLVDALQRNVNIVLLDFIASPFATEALRHFQRGANTGEGIKYEVAFEGIKLNEAIRNLLGKRAGMIVLAGRHGSNVPDVVGDFAGEDGIYGDATLVFLPGCAGAGAFGCLGSGCPALSDTRIFLCSGPPGRTLCSS